MTPKFRIFKLHKKRWFLETSTKYHHVTLMKQAVVLSLESAVETKTSMPGRSDFPVGLSGLGDSKK